MRIAIIAGPYVPIPPMQYGGIEQVISYLIKGLIEAGHEPILIGTGDSKVDCELIPIVKKSIGFAANRAELPAIERKVAHFNAGVTATLHKLMPSLDIIHSHGFDLKPFKRFPHLVTLHNKIGLPELPYLEERRDLNYVSISKNQQQVFPDLNYVGVVHNGEDPRDFPLVTKPERYVCFLGRFDEDKSPHLAIELAISRGYKIKLAGKIDHDSEHYFAAKVAPHFDNPLVEYVGELGFADKIKLLSNALCNLHPTNFREPFGLTVLEAAYCGTPTMAIRRGAMSELIEHGRTGLLVEDFVEGYHCLEKCLAMDRQYVANRARTLFNYQTMTERYIAAYERVLEVYTGKDQYQKVFSSLRRTGTPKPQGVWRRHTVPRSL